MALTGPGRNVEGPYRTGAGSGLRPRAKSPILHEPDDAKHGDACVHLPGLTSLQTSRALIFYAKSRSSSLNGPPWWQAASNEVGIAVRAAGDLVIAVGHLHHEGTSASGAYLNAGWIGSHWGPKNQCDEGSRCAARRQTRFGGCGSISQEQRESMSVPRTSHEAGHQSHCRQEHRKLP